MRNFCPLRPLLVLAPTSVAALAHGLPRLYPRLLLGCHGGCGPFAIAAPDLAAFRPRRRRGVLKVNGGKFAEGRGAAALQPAAI